MRYRGFAGDDQRHNNRSQTQPDQPLPWCGAEPVPQPIGKKYIHKAKKTA
jgi:hypothetical protein